jgi:hypothetical protein
MQKNNKVLIVLIFMLAPRKRFFDILIYCDASRLSAFKELLEERGCSDRTRYESHPARWLGFRDQSRFDEGGNHTPCWKKAIAEAKFMIVARSALVNPRVQRLGS